MWLIWGRKTKKFSLEALASSSFTTHRVESEASDTFVHVELHDSFHLGDDFLAAVIQVRLLGGKLMEIIP